MATERISTGKSIYGGSYAQDSKGNIGYGKNESIARQALQSAQNKAAEKKDKK
jgi:hypothetical protein